MNILCHKCYYLISQYIFTGIQVTTWLMMKKMVPRLGIVKFQFQRNFVIYIQGESRKKEPFRNMATAVTVQYRDLLASLRCHYRWIRLFYICLYIFNITLTDECSTVCEFCAFIRFCSAKA